VGMYDSYVTIYWPRTGYQLEYLYWMVIADFKKNKIATHVLEFPISVYQGGEISTLRIQLWRYIPVFRPAIVFDGRSKFRFQYG